MAKVGKKNCSNCNEEIGIRSLLCPKCAFHFPTNIIRQDLLDEKNKAKEKKTDNPVKRGRKKCPSCNEITATVTKICPKCNFDLFTASQKNKEKLAAERKIKEEKRVKKLINSFKKPDKIQKTEIEEKINPMVEKALQLPMPVFSEKLTPKEHAERILGYGAKRASMLLGQSKGVWSHVDWNLVKEGLDIK